MQAVEAFKSFGLISIILTWLTIGVVLAAVPRDVSHSISYHVALRRKFQLIYAVSATGAIILISLFAGWWLVPHFHLSNLFTTLFALIIVLEFITTCVPLTEGRSYTIHQLTSYGAACLVPILLIVLALSSQIAEAARFVNTGAVVLMVIFMGLFFWVEKSRKYYLIFQGIYIAAFHAALLTTAYLH